MINQYYCTKITIEQRTKNGYPFYLLINTITRTYNFGKSIANKKADFKLSYRDMQKIKSILIYNNYNLDLDLQF